LWQVSGFLSLPTKGHPPPKAPLSEQISDDWRWLQNTTKLPLSREATPLIRQHFHCRKGSLIRGDYCTTEILLKIMLKTHHQ